jgi:hypothetical protein
MNERPIDRAVGPFTKMRGIPKQVLLLEEWYYNLSAKIFAPERIYRDSFGQEKSRK